MKKKKNDFNIKNVNPQNMLSDKELDYCAQMEELENDANILSGQLHSILFSEEYDLMYDSIAEAKKRKYGISPMNESYVKKISQKRNLMGVTPLNSSGCATSNETAKGCYTIAWRLLTKKFRKPILYVDMDNVLVDFESGIKKLDESVCQQYDGCLDEVPGIFRLMEPMPGAIDAVKRLAGIFDVFILSTAPWDNASAWSDKLNWIKRYIPVECHKRLILTHHKNLNTGDYLIDDRTKNGADEFVGTLVHFGTEEFPDWDEVEAYLFAEFYVKGVGK